MESRRALSFRYSNKSFHQPLDPFATSVHLIPCAKVIKFNYHQPSTTLLPLQYSQSNEIVRCNDPPPVQIPMANLSLASERGSRKIKLITSKRLKKNQRSLIPIQQNPQVLSNKSNNNKDKCASKPVLEASFSQKQMQNHRYTYSVPIHITTQGPSCSIFKSCQDQQINGSQVKVRKVNDDCKQPLNSLSTKQDTPARHKIFQQVGQGQNHLLPIKNFVFSKQSPFNQQISVNKDKKQQKNEHSLQIAEWAISRNFGQNKIIDYAQQTINDQDIPSMILQNWGEINSICQSHSQFSSPEKKTSNKI